MSSNDELRPTYDLKPTDQVEAEQQSSYSEIELSIRAKQVIAALINNHIQDTCDQELSAELMSFYEKLVKSIGLDMLSLEIMKLVKTFSTEKAAALAIKEFMEKKVLSNQNE